MSRTDDAPLSASTGPDGWARCPGCGFRFKPDDRMAFDGVRHVRCGQRIVLEGRHAAPVTHAIPAVPRAEPRPTASGQAGNTEPFSHGMITGVVLTLLVVLGGGTVLAVLVGEIHLRDIWALDNLVRIGTASVVVGAIFGVIFATPDPGTGPAKDAAPARPAVWPPRPSLGDADWRRTAIWTPSPFEPGGTSSPFAPRAPTPPPSASHRPSSTSPLVAVPDDERGRYFKHAFDYLLAHHRDSDFTYEDLPEAPRGAVEPYQSETRPDWLPDGAEHVRIGSAERWPKSDLLRELNEQELTRTVGPSTFALTDRGREGSMILKGTATSAFLVFERDALLDESEALSAAEAAAADIGGRLALASGKASYEHLVELTQNAARIRVGEGASALLDVSGSTFTPFLVAAWTDAPDGLARLHDAVSDAFLLGYSGMLVWPGNPPRRGFLDQSREQLGLRPGPDVITGRLDDEG